MEGIRRALVQGLVLITGIAIEQAPSVGHPSSCHQIFRIHCSVHSYHISFSYMSSKVQGCGKREHRNMCAVLSAFSPHAHVVSPLK